MRSRTGCQACRERHVKCVKPEGAQKCQRCFEIQRDCAVDIPLFFRPVKTVRMKTPGGQKIKQDLKHTPSQVWVDVPSNVQFVSPEQDPADSRPPLPVSLDAESGASVHPVIDDNDDDAIAPEESPSFNVRTPQVPHQIPDWVNNASSTQADIHNAAISPDLQHSSPQARFSDQATSVSLSPYQSLSHTRTIEYTSSHLMQLSSPHTGIGFTWPFQEVREAQLLHHYIIHISPQFDSCDKHMYFGEELPKRAAYYPVLKNAIFATASRHMSILAGTEDLDSPRYLGECLQLLITALEDPLLHLDENLLAAVILLRTHEEMSENDERHHLYGSTRILNSISSFAADGGLRECASWVSLRQHIYISLTSQQPLPIDLTSYRSSNVFTASDDGAWANRMIFILARVLKHIFDGEVEHLSTEKWSEFDEEVTAWHDTKPWHFAPLFIAKKSSGMEQPKRYNWPELLMCDQAQVVGLQHYYLAKIVLALFNPRLSRFGFESFRIRRESESIVRENLRNVIGLAVSNENCYVAMFHASHALAVCGPYLDSRAERDAAIEFLTHAQHRKGWITSHLVRNLREQWRS